MACQAVENHRPFGINGTEKAYDEVCLGNRKQHISFFRGLEASPAQYCVIDPWSM